MPSEDFLKKETAQRELVVLYPGEELLSKTGTGKIFRTIVKPYERVITFGEDTAIILEDYKDYFFIYGIHVEPEEDRKQGIGTFLYEEALKLAKAEEKKGILSAKHNRQSQESMRMWERFYESGRATKVTIDGDEYDAILC